jgi:hypothetical protein
MEFTEQQFTGLKEKAPDVDEPHKGLFRKDE